MMMRLLLEELKFVFYLKLKAKMISSLKSSKWLLYTLNASYLEGQIFLELVFLIIIELFSKKCHFLFIKFMGADQHHIATWIVDCFVR